MNNCHPLARYMMTYFYHYLPEVKGLSINTILSYRDTIKLLLQFASEYCNKPVDRLTVEDLKEETILKFLSHIEHDMGNSIRTRNSRLAAIRSLFGFIGRENPALLQISREIRSIPVKRREHSMIEYLDANELQAIFKSLDTLSIKGVRDRALLLLLYNTGARVQEIVDLTIDDLRLDASYQVKLIGKGRKQRACPLWPETVNALIKYIDLRSPQDSTNKRVFLNTNGRTITRFGIRYLVKTYAQKAALECPTLKNKTIGPHTFRHSTATHLIQAGNDINMVRLWLGHASINTTHMYVEINMDMKRKILCSTKSPVSTKSSSCKWNKPGILKWLDNISRNAVLS